MRSRRHGFRDTVVTVGVRAFTLSVVCIALPYPAWGDQCRNDVLVAGGGQVSSASYALSYSLGLTFVDSAVSTTFHETQGFWAVDGMGSQQTYPTITYVTDAAARNNGPALLEMRGVFGACPEARLVSGALPAIHASVVPVEPTRSQLQFDLTGATAGSWDLVVSTPHGDDTLEDALVVYGEALDVFRSTVSQAHDHTPAISRAGSTLGSMAFISTRNGAPNLYIKNLDSLDIAPLAPVLGSVLAGAGHPTWSGDGARIVCAVAGDLFRLNPLVPSDTLRITDQGSDASPAWSPVGNRIAFARLNFSNDREIWTIKSNGDSLMQVTTPVTGRTDETAAWSRDGKRIVFSRGPAPNSGIYTVSADAGEAGGMDTLTAPSAFTDTEPAWSPDGRWIAFASDRDGDFDIYVMDSRGEAYGVFQVTTDASEDRNPEWNHDGTKLVFSSDRSGGFFDIFFVNGVPSLQDTDGDALPNSQDACPAQVRLAGEIDRDFDGCTDFGSSMRAIHAWPPDRMPITYELQPDGDSRIENGSDLQALRNAFTTWENVSNVDIDFVEDASSPLDRAVAGDGRNTVTFKDVARFTGSYQLVLALAAVTSSVADTVVGGRWYRPGEIVDVDILFNEFWGFSTPTHDPGSVAWDLERVATHEVGHLLGFAHTPLRRATMFPVVPLGDSATLLTADDAVLARRAYGSSPSALAEALAVEGQVSREGTPITGAAVYAISTSSGDTIQATLSGANGKYRFFDVNESIRIFVTPLDGSSAANGTRPSDIHALLASLANTEFIAEYWDGVAEAAVDPNTGQIVTVGMQPVPNANIALFNDGVSPTVQSFTPANGTDSVSAVTSLSVEFNEEVQLVSNSIVLRPSPNGPIVTGVAALLAAEGNRIIRFTPDDPLAFGTEYLLTVSGVPDRASNFLAAPVSITFTVQFAPPLAITALSPGAAPVGGIVAISGYPFSIVEANNTVYFNGAQSTTPFVAKQDELWVRVPPGATSGNVSVQVSAETSSPLHLDILPPREVPSGNRIASLQMSGNPRAVAVNSDSLVYVATDLGAVIVTHAAATPAAQIAWLAIPGCCTDVVTLPGQPRALALGNEPPRLYEIVELGGIPQYPMRSVELSEAARGIAAAPGGGVILVAYPDRVELVRADAGPTFGDVIRYWAAADDEFAGELSVSPTASLYAYATTTNDRIAVLSMAPASAGNPNGAPPLAMIPVGENLGEIATTLDGERLLAADNAIRLLGLLGPELESKASAGEYRSLAVSPEGAFAYAADVVRDNVRVLDLRGGNLIDSGTFATGPDPIDVVTSSDGRFVYVATSGGRKLEVYDTLESPRIVTVSPPSGGPGTMITIAGSGIWPVEASNTVLIDDTPHTVLDATSNHVVVAQLPGANSGSVLLESLGRASNALSYRVVNRTDPGRFDLGRPFASGGSSAAELLLTPDGRMLLASHTNGALAILQAHRESSNLHRPLHVLTPAQSTLGATSTMRATPDGRKLYAADFAQGRIAVFDVTDASPFVVPAGHVFDSVNGTALQPTGFDVTPDGTRVLISSNANDIVYETATATDTVLARISGFTAPASIVVHPLGTRAYVADGNQIRAVDIDPGSPTYRGVSTANQITGASELRLLPSPTGARLWVLARSGTNHALHGIDTAGFTPTHANAGSVPLSSGATMPVLARNHSGTLLFVANPNAQRLLVYGVAGGAPVALDSLDHAALASARSMCLSHDDARLYVATASDSVLVANLTPATSLAFQAGTQQFGIVGLTLAAPLVVRLDGEPQELLDGTLVTFRTTPGQGGTFGGDPMLHTIANDLGIARASNFVDSLPPSADIVVELGGTSIMTTLPVVPDVTTEPPHLVARAPQDEFTPQISTPIAALFSEPIDLTSVDTASFSVKAGDIPVAGRFTYADHDRQIIFTPLEELDYGTLYTVEISVSAPIRDMHDDAAAATTFTFTTALEVSPPVLQSVKEASGKIGTEVVFAGQGFSRNLALNQVYFGARQAVITSARPRRIKAIVPQGAVTDSVYVAVNGSPSNKLRFHVLNPPPAPITGFDASTQLPKNCQRIAVLRDGSRAYVTSSGANAVIPFVVNGLPERAIPVGFLPFGVTAAPDGKHVYVSNFGSNDVSVIGTDPNNSQTFHKVIATVQVGANPAGLAVHPDGASLYVVNRGDSTVTIVDTDPGHATFHKARASANTGTTVKTSATTPDGGGVLVGTSEGLLILDPVTGQTEAFLNIGSAVEDIDVHPSGALGLVLTADNRLSLLDLRPNASKPVIASTPTSANPVNVAASKDGQLAVVTLETGFVESWQLVALAGASKPSSSSLGFNLVPLGTTAVGDNPRGLAFNPEDPSRILVVNEGSQSVTTLLVSAAWTNVASSLIGSLGSTSGTAWADYDGDGDADAYLVRIGAPNRLLRNDAGVFTEVTHGTLAGSGVGRAAVWGDADRDGDPDLYLVNNGGANVLFRNDGGTFVDATSGPLGDPGTSMAAAWADFDRDRDLDLYIVNDTEANRLLRNDGGLVFTDITNNGRPATNQALADASGAGHAVSWIDHDRDDDLDLYVGNDGENRLIRNDGFYQFASVATGDLVGAGSTRSTAWGDYDNDGDLDLFLGRADATSQLLRNDGGGTFNNVTAGPLGAASTTNAAAWGDYDRDGDLDLYLARDINNVLLRNDGNTTFVDVTPQLLADASNTRGVMWVDYDNDGDVDLHLSNDGLDNLLRNDIPTTNHWLQVRLQTTFTNANAIGARVRVVAGGVKQLRQIDGGSGQTSQALGTAAFGLGATTVADSVEVIWPTGKHQVLLQVAADQILTIVEDYPTDVEQELVPRRFALHANRPNPFNPSTTIEYDVPKASRVHLRIYDVRGRLVRALEQGVKREPGRYAVVWNGQDERGVAVASGVYFYALHAGDFEATRKMVVLR